MPIRRLQPEVSSRIAAGEVIERPASVCKELIENSLDAGASRIVVEIIDGGRSSIRISDDGSGIPTEQVPLAVDNFSTSKISRIEDMSSLSTLGFRGEALASIRAVSRLRIVTRTTGEDAGREMEWRGGELLKDAPVARTPGTDVYVEDLFYNLPARKKFLSSPAAELRRTNSLIQSFALAFPAVAFSMNDEGRELFVYPASDLTQRVEAIFGSTVFEHLTPFEDQSGQISISGFLSQPDMTRGNRTLQFYFVNGRIIRDRLLSHAVHQAYHSLIPRDKYPMLVLFLEVPPEGLDVNVHPTKAEIRFRDERDVHRLVHSSIRNALGAQDRSFRDKVQSVYQSIFPGSEERKEGLPQATDNESEKRGEQLEWFFKETPMSLFEESPERHIVTSGGLYWQLHESFILIQIRGGMVIVDQHAAHERILFDAAKRSIEETQRVVQPLLFPATLELTHEEYEQFEELQDLLPSLGFDVEPFGPRSIIVRGIPAGVRNWNDGQLLQQILSDEGGDLDALLKSFACHSAVRAGASLTTEEMESLTDQLFATEYPFTCPHGRPTMLRLGTAELERRFQRTAKSEK